MGHDGHRRTLQETADRLGVSLQTVDQGERRAIRKLREGLGDILEHATFDQIAAAMRTIDWTQFDGPEADRSGHA